MLQRLQKSHTVVPANAMGDGHSKEIKSYSYLQEIPRLIRGRKIYNHVDNTHPPFTHTLDSIPGQKSSILPFPPYFKINYSTIFPSKPNSSSPFFPFGFPNRIPYEFIFSPTRASIPLFDHTSICTGIQVIMSLNMKFSPASFC